MKIINIVALISICPMRSMPEGKEQFVTIFDAGATGYRNMDTSASLMMADFLQVCTDCSDVMLPQKDC